jgi:ubiquinone/menaquinone biosynthesis C-methylase UbiE
MTGEEFDSLVRFFDGMALTNWLGSVHDTLKNEIGSWENKNVLDVGCGTGRLLLRGAEEAKHLVGVDLSEKMIEAAKQIYAETNKINCNFVVADAYDLPFPNKEFDIVVSTCVFFLLPEPEKGLSEMLRVAKDGGVIAMLNPAENMCKDAAADYCTKYNLKEFEEKTLMQWSNVSTSRHRYSKDELTQLLKGHGAKEVVHKEVVDGLALITIAKL